MTEVRLIAQLSGTRNGVDWPAIYSTIDLPTDEANAMIAAGTAEDPKLHPEYDAPNRIGNLVDLNGTALDMHAATATRQEGRPLTQDLEAELSAEPEDESKRLAAAAEAKTKAAEVEVATASNAGVETADTAKPRKR